MPPLTDPIERSLAGSAGSHESWARTVDRPARTRPARQALEQKWLDLADGDPQRAESYRSAHYKRMALKSVQARRRRAGQGTPQSN